MKERSADAIARRAAKRGRTVEEQKAFDRDNKAPQSEDSAPGASVPEAAPTVGSGSSAAAAGSSNGAGRGIGKGGGRGRGDSGKGDGGRGAGGRGAGKGAGKGGGKGAGKGGGKGGKGDGKGGGKGKGKGKGKGDAPRREPGDPENAWGVVASTERLEENKQLRAKYMADPDSLFEDDRARAKALLERDSRKKVKKEVVKKTKESRKERTLLSRTNRKRARFGDKSATPALDRPKKAKKTQDVVKAEG